MTRRLLISAWITASGCTFTPNFPNLDPEAGETVVVEMTRASDGTLKHCVNQSCTSYPNPYNCHRLTVSIETATGATCEACYGESGAVLSESCDDTLTSCAVITASDPDCVVCAFINGSVLFSNCMPSQLDCTYFSPSAPAGGANSLDAGACEVCYDEYGKEVISSCTNECASVSCPAITCADGFKRARSPGDCCDHCVPNDSCTNVLCSQEVAIPECPADTKLMRDPTDCCHYYCEPLQCPTLDPNFSCPPGYTIANTYPECSRCVPSSSGNTCVTSADCAAGEMCSTEAGDCQGAPCGNHEKCESKACYGQCLPLQPSCPQQELTPVACEGEMYSDGLDATGCPLPPSCHCADGTVSFDGRCPNLCANVSCITRVHECDAGQRLVTDYPNCCGICVEKDQCVAGESTAGESFTSSLNCPAVSCGPGYHPEMGPECCEVCVRDEIACKSSGDCLTGEKCDSDGARSPTCAPAVYCEDTDGADPYTAGTVSGLDALHQPYADKETCLTESVVVEHYCFKPFPGSTQTWQGEALYTCPYGCIDGACRSAPP